MSAKPASPARYCICIYQTTTCAHSNVHAGRPYHEVETKQKGRKVKKVQKEVKKFLEPLKDAGLLPVKLELKKYNQENLDINLLDGNEITSSVCSSQNDRDIPRMAHLQVKHSISQNLYHELYMFNKSLPKPTEVSKL